MNNPDFSPFEENRLRYRFGEFTLDLANGFLRRGEQELVLRPKPFEVLVYLVQHHGKVVSKTALIEAVWPDVFVSDNSLAQCMVEIRRALDDDSQQIIRAVARRGYIFATPVASPVIEIPSRQPWMPAETGNPAHIAGRRRLNLRIAGALALVLMVLAGLISVWLTRSSRLDLRYAKITNFTDSAMAPALSTDGRMIAFFRSDNWFLTRDEAHIKLLPNGEPVQLTHDPRLKCCLAFSPDGSRVAYTTLENTVGWRTYTVPSLGGEPTLLLSNAAAVSWLDSRRILFSEVRTGIHMGIVTALEDRSEYREIYFPAHQRAMAHFSSPSPDRKWILVVEMGPDGGWEPCRLIPFDGTSAGRQAGPQGQCIAAAWSPNGRWMYFSAAVEGKHHLWRQRFPSGKPELITSSSTEEDGVAVTPDGRSLITSVGIRQGVLWIHDTAGERPLTKEGDVAPERAWPTPAALFSPDGESIYHLMRRDSPESPSALWRTNLRSGKSELVISGPSIEEYDVSSDGKEVIFAARNGKGVSELWLASMDRSSTPKRIGSSGEVSPRFGPEDQVVFQWSDGRANHLLRMNKDGSGRAKASDEPIGELFGVSPDRRIAVVGRASPDVHTAAVTIGGTLKRKICKGYCSVAWDPSGRFLYVGVQPNSSVATGKTAVIPIPAGESLPELPELGLDGLESARSLHGVQFVDGYEISPGPSPDVFAYMKQTVHRNLMQVRLPD